MESVGSYEAKTHLPRLLDAVARGRSFTITKHGRGIARLVPIAATGDPAAVIEDLRAARTGVTLGAETFRDLKDEGRR